VQANPSRSISQSFTAWHRKLALKIAVALEFVAARQGVLLVSKYLLRGSRDLIYESSFIYQWRSAVRSSKSRHRGVADVA